MLGRLGNLGPKQPLQSKQSILYAQFFLPALKDFVWSSELLYKRQASLWVGDLSAEKFFPRATFEK